LIGHIFHSKAPTRLKKWLAIVHAMGNKIVQQLQQRVQQPPQPNTRNNQHQQTKQGLIEHRKDYKGQPETTRAISDPWHFFA